MVFFGTRVWLPNVHVSLVIILVLPLGSANSSHPEFMFSTAAALFIGLGTRIVIDKLRATAPDIPPAPESLGDVVLFGVVQGVGLYYALMEFPDFALVVATVIAGHLLFEFAMTQDLGKCATTLLSIALGILVTDVLSQLIEDGFLYDSAGDETSEVYDTYSSVRRKRLVKFRATTEYSSVPPSAKPVRSQKQQQDQGRKWRIDSSVPSITSSNSDTVDPNRIMDPLQREIATLRARASLADSERRRFKEEKKWALSQGNMARASQMSWQVKRYTALMRSFTREADARFLEGRPWVYSDGRAFRAYGKPCHSFW